MDIGSIGIGIGLAKYFTECHCVDVKPNRISRINWRTDGNLARSVHRIGVNNGTARATGVFVKVAVMVPLAVTVDVKVAVGVAVMVAVYVGVLVVVGVHV